MKFLNNTKLKILRDTFFEKKGIRYYFQALKKDLWFAWDFSDRLYNLVLAWCDSS